MSDAEILRNMKAAGVPDAALMTTLPLEGCPDIRTFIREAGYRSASGYHGVYIHPKKVTDAGKARKVFHVIAKEMILHRESVYCISLDRLVEGLSSDYDSTAIDRAESATTLFLADFYERGAPFPLAPWQAGVVRSWIRSKFENGGAVSLLGDGPMREAVAWWPPAFLGFLSENMHTFVIG